MTKSSANTRTFDVRVTERNIKHGSMSRKELEKHLASLPDVASKAISLGEVAEQRGNRDD